MKKEIIIRQKKSGKWIKKKIKIQISVIDGWVYIGNKEIVGSIIFDELIDILMKEMGMEIKTSPLLEKDTVNIEDIKDNLARN